MAPPPPGLAAWLSLLEAQAVLVDVLGRDLEREHGMALSWLEVLMFLADAPDGRMRMLDLADRVVLSRSGITRLVDRMERAGLVERAACREDRRGTYAVITGRGREALSGAAPAHLLDVEERLAGNLSAADLRALRTLLGKVLAGLGRPARACPLPPRPVARRG